MSIHLTSTFKPCEDCTLGKTKRGCISKKAVVCSKMLEKSLFFDISSPSTPTFGGKNHWLLVIHDSTGYALIKFFLKKLNLKNVKMGLIKNLKTKYNIQVQYLCFYNRGENVDFKRTNKQEWMGIKFKYTALGTPQQISHVEWKLITLFNWVHAMLNSGKFTAFLRNNLWAEATSTATLLDNYLVTPNRDLSPFQHFWEGKDKHSVFDSKIW